MIKIRAGVNSFAGGAKAPAGSMVKSKEVTTGFVSERVAQEFVQRCKELKVTDLQASCEAEQADSLTQEKAQAQLMEEARALYGKHLAEEKSAEDVRSSDPQVKDARAAVRQYLGITNDGQAD